MSKNIHAASNAIIANYLNKEVTVTMTRNDAAGLALLLKDRIFMADDTLSDDERNHLRRLHLALVSA